MRGAGGVHGTEKRRSLWPRTCEPSPTTKRPPVEPARSQPTSRHRHRGAGEGDRDAGVQFDPLGRDAGHGQREKRVVLVLHRDDAVVALAPRPRAPRPATRRRSCCGTVVNTRIAPLPLPLVSVAGGSGHKIAGRGKPCFAILARCREPHLSGPGCRWRCCRRRCSAPARRSPSCCSARGVSPWLLAGLLYLGSGVGLGRVELARPAARRRAGRGAAAARRPAVAGAGGAERRRGGAGPADGRPGGDPGLDGEPAVEPRRPGDDGDRLADVPRECRPPAAGSARRRSWPARLCCRGRAGPSGFGWGAAGDRRRLPRLGHRQQSDAPAQRRRPGADRA